MALITAAIVSRRGSTPQAALMAASMIILSTLVATSHAAGRMEGRTALLVLSAIHMLAVGCWIGGLPYFLLTLKQAPNLVIRRWVCHRFSKLAALSVVVLALRDGCCHALCRFSRSSLRHCLWSDGRV